MAPKEKLLVLRVPVDFDVQNLNEEGLDLYNNTITVDNYDFSLVKGDLSNLKVLENVESEPGMKRVSNFLFLTMFLENSKRLIYAELKKGKNETVMSELALHWKRSPFQSNRTKVQLPAGEVDNTTKKSIGKSSSMTEDVKNKKNKKRKRR